jgi:hypothetical protein
VHCFGAADADDDPQDLDDRSYINELKFLSGE